MMNNIVRYGDGGWGMMKNWGDDSTVIGGYGLGLHYVFGIITWFLVICVLVALLRWLWKNGSK